MTMMMMMLMMMVANQRTNYLILPLLALGVLKMIMAFFYTALNSNVFLNLVDQYILMLDVNLYHLRSICIDMY